MVISDLVRSLLKNRGIETDEDIEVFLSPDYAAHTHDPYLLEGMGKAVSRLLGAIDAAERIAVYADFDCDGIPGAALFSDFFNKIGYTNFQIYIPHRDKEGYGFHVEAIQALSQEGVQLIITIDVGTVAVEGVNAAKELGIEVIVTDHHEIIGEVPKAYAILNPKLGEYPFRDLCGAAVAFKLVQATLSEGKKRGVEGFMAIPDGWEKWLLDLVGIATIADMVPLVGENRALAHFGLQVLRKSPRPGIVALCNKLRLRRGDLAEDDIGFSLGPRINAASRMGEPMSAFMLLTTKDQDEAEKIVVHLEELNASRKGAVSAIVRSARKTIVKRFSDSDRVIVLGDTAWRPALLGLAANSIMQERGGLVCMWGRDANGRLKGSCRSDGSVSLSDLFGKARDAFVESGGHDNSGGFTVSHEQVHDLHETLARAAEEIVHKGGEKGDVGADLSAEALAKADAHVTLSEISRGLFSEVSQLAPFGTGNPKPVFLVESLTISSVRRFGKENNHVEVQLLCQKSGHSARAFQFFKSPEDFSLAPSAGESANMLATIERDTYRGGLALRIVDMLP